MPYISLTFKCWGVNVFCVNEYMKPLLSHYTVRRYVKMCIKEYVKCCNEDNSWCIDMK